MGSLCGPFPEMITKVNEATEIKVRITIKCDSNQSSALALVETQSAKPPKPRGDEAQAQRNQSWFRFRLAAP